MFYFMVEVLLNKVWMAVAATIILAVSGLGYAFTASEANQRGDENLNAEIEAVSSVLTLLQSRMATLNSSLAQLFKSLGDLDADLEQDIMGLQANMSSLLTQIVGLRSDISAIQLDITHLKSDMTNLSAEISSAQEDIIAVQILITELQTKLTSIETRVSTLESKRPLVVRIWFLSFEPDDIPATGNDYLLDVKLSWGPSAESYVYGRTGHSRFVVPNYLDLSVSRTLTGSTVEITIFAYWHLDDYPIDIDPDPAHGIVIFTPSHNSGASLSLQYILGSLALQGSVDGKDDGFLVDLYDAHFTYKIETLP